MTVIHQHLVDTRLTHHQLLLSPVMSTEQHHTTLILIQLARGALIQRPTHQPTEIPGTEPDLGFQQDRAQWAVMAVEGGGG